MCHRQESDIHPLRFSERTTGATPNRAAAVGWVPRRDVRHRSGRLPARPAECRLLGGSRYVALWLFAKIPDVPLDTEVEDARAVPGLHKASYTAQANKRALCSRLTAFVRLVDALLANAMHSLAVESVQYLFGYMRSLDLVVANGNANDDARHHSIVTVDGETIMLRHPPNARKNPNFQPKADDKSDAAPLFKVCLP